MVTYQKNFLEATEKLSHHLPHLRYQFEYPQRSQAPKNHQELSSWFSRHILRHPTKKYQAHLEGTKPSVKFIQFILYYLHFLRAHWPQLSFSGECMCYVGQVFTRCRCNLLTLNYEPKGKSSDVCRNECGYQCILPLFLSDTLEALLVTAGWKFLWLRILNLMLNLMLTILLII